MYCENHEIIQIDSNIFKCKNCNYIHECGSEKCDKIFYNADQTQVCSVTGLCFHQRVCDIFASNLNSCDDPTYEHPIKKNQCLSNRTMSPAFVCDIIDALDVLKNNTTAKNIFCTQIINLWNEYIESINETNKYTHRKDKRCFVVAIIKSMKTGIFVNDNDIVVHKHEKFESKKLNKKSQYKHFRVSDIRDGFNMIKTGFQNKQIKNTINLRLYI